MQTQMSPSKCYKSVETIPGSNEGLKYKMQQRIKTMQVLGILCPLCLGLSVLKTLRAFPRF